MWEDYRRDWQALPGNPLYTFDAERKRRTSHEASLPKVPFSSVEIVPLTFGSCFLPLGLPGALVCTTMITMEAEKNEPTQVLEIPLFPLNLVLYPGMALPLHIFEERYLSMIGTCIEKKEPFGVVLIKEGSEVGAPATPERVGTTTRILESEILPGGRLKILTQGEERFEVLEVVQEQPHLIGRVRMLSEEKGNASETQIGEVQGEFELYLRDMARLSGKRATDVSSPQSPNDFSYTIASNLCSSIKLPSEIRQHWLEVESNQERLDSLLTVLRGLNKTLAQEIKRRASDVGLN